MARRCRRAKTPMKQPAFELVMLAFLLLPTVAMGAPPAPTDQNTASIIPQPLHVTQQAAHLSCGPIRASLPRTPNFHWATRWRTCSIPRRFLSQSRPIRPTEQHHPPEAGCLESHGPEGYHLGASPTVITISAAAPAGIFYGMQTLRQLLPPAIFSPTLVQGVAWTVPAVSIDDRPASPGAA